MIDGEVFDICARIAKIWTDIQKLMLAKIEESKTGSWFEAAISPFLSNPCIISNIFPSVASLVILRKGIFHLQKWSQSFALK